MKSVSVCELKLLDVQCWNDPISIGEESAIRWRQNDEVHDKFWSVIEINVWRSRPARPGQAIYKPNGFSCSRQASDHYIWLPHSCLCQTDIWKSFEMVRSGFVRKMHSDDGRMIKFIISFGSVTETCFWRSRHVWLLDSSRHSNNYIRSAWERLALKLSYS